MKTALFCIKKIKKTANESAVFLVVGEWKTNYLNRNTESLNYIYFS